MKKNDWLLVASVGVYSYLFYEETAGINFLIFNLVLITALLIKDKTLAKNRNWIIAATGSLLSALAIGYYGHNLSVVANIISLSFLSALAFKGRPSAIVAILSSFYSYLSSIVYIILDWAERRKQESDPGSGTSFRKIILITIPLLVTLLFFYMYRESNPAFRDFLDNGKNENSISMKWILFTSGGFLLLYGFFYHRKIKWLSQYDENAPDDLRPENSRVITFLGKELSVPEENYSGVIMFLLLNALLLLVNVLDANFLFSDHQIPKNLNHSQFVHQGTGIVIMSILAAIVIILFYFRGALNFFERNKTLKLLAYLWIIQNVFLIVSTALRNGIYVSDYGLTYKRIGVYAYLFLVALGLLTTLIKIAKVKSNNYLFRINGWLFYGVLVVSSLFNWDVIITRFNIQKATWLEKSYLYDLSDANLPDLFLLQKDTSHYKRIFVMDRKTERKEDYLQFSGGRNYDIELSRRLNFFLKQRKNQGWKSWNYDNTRIHRELAQLNTNKQLTALHFDNCELNYMGRLYEFSNLEELHVPGNTIDTLAELNIFPLLRKIDLSHNQLKYINGIENFHQLEYLDITGNDIRDFSPLYGLKGLKELRVTLFPGSHELAILYQELPYTKINGVAGAQPGDQLAE